MFRVLVTGGTGFVGSPIIEALRAQHSEWKISVFDLKMPTTPEAGVEYEIGDVTNGEEVRAVFAKIKPDVVIHTAGLVPELAHRYGRKLWDRVYNVNVNGTRIMLHAAKTSGVKAFVWTGSCTAVTDDMRTDYRNIDETWPTSTDQTLIYGESKAVAEKCVLNASTTDFRTCALRPSVLFGPNDYQLIPSIHACLRKGETPFVVGTGENLWDITYVANVADAHVLAVENLMSSKTAAGQAIFISNEEPITFRDFCLAVWATFGYYPPFEIHIPESIASFLGHVAEWTTSITGTPTTLSRGSVRDACATRYCNTAKAQRLLNYKPKVGIEEGMRISCDVREALAKLLPCN